MSSFLSPHINLFRQKCTQAIISFVLADLEESKVWNAMDIGRLSLPFVIVPIAAHSECKFGYLAHEIHTHQITSRTVHDPLRAIIL